MDIRTSLNSVTSLLEAPHFAELTGRDGLACRVVVCREISDHAGAFFPVLGRPPRLMEVRDAHG